MDGKTIYEEVRKLVNNKKGSLLILNPEDEYFLFKYLEPEVDMGFLDSEDPYLRPKLINTLLGLKVIRSHDIKRKEFIVV